MARFFYIISRAAEEAEIIDCFAARYGWSYAEVTALQITQLAELYKILSDKEAEEKVFKQWVSILPMMWTGMAKFVEYDEFKTRLTGSDIDTRPAEEILAEAREAERWVNGSV